MASRAVVWVLLLLAASALFAAMTPLPNANVRSEGWTSWLSGVPTGASSDISSGLPAQTPAQGASVSASGGSSVDFFWVGAEAASQGTLPNSGVQATIQVVNQSAPGCLSYWISDDSSANVWGQVGYFICGHQAPLAFYQVWNLSAYAILTTGTADVTVGPHTFSISLLSGTTWAYAVDGEVLGVYDMRSSNSSSSYPVFALSEEGYVSSPWTPSPVEFDTAIQVLKAGTWSPVQLAASYGGGWGVEGNIQDPSLPPDAMTVGGSSTELNPGTALWAQRTSDSTSTTSSAPTVTVTCAPAQVVIGTHTTCIASVNGSPPPAGKIVWSTNSAGRFSRPACILSAGSCEVDYVPASAGSQTNITATYLGKDDSMSSAGSLLLTVTPKTSRTTIVCKQTSAASSSSETIKCAARVAGYSPKGTVTWSSTGTAVLSVPSGAVCTLTGESCSWTFTATSPGTVTIQAAYGGSPDNTESVGTRILELR